MKITIQMTYSTITPESAEDGEHADHGFAEPGGWTYSIADESFRLRCDAVGREQALADMTPEPEQFDNIADVVSFLADYGPLEASCWPLCDNGHCWLSESEGSENFSTGEVKQLAFHIEAPTGAIHKEILQAALDN